MFIFSVLLAFSCNIQEESAMFLQNAIPISGKTIEMNCFIGKPHEVVCVDSFLLFSDYYENKALTAYNLRNDQFSGRFLSLGRGPGEVIAPINLFVTSEKKMSVHQYQTGDMFFYNFPEMKMQHKIHFDNKTRSIKKTQNYFIGCGVYDGGRFSIYDNSGNLLRYMGEYPFRGNYMDAIERFIIYQGYICTCPTRDFFVTCGAYCDNLEFYEIKNNLGILLKKYESYDSNAQFIDQQLYRNEHTRYAYQWAYGTEKYCYLLYVGKSNVETKKKKIRHKYIIVFDWCGNHIKTYQIDVGMRSFCVDESDETLYGIVLKDEYEIMSFDL